MMSGINATFGKDLSPIINDQTIFANVHVQGKPSFNILPETRNDKYPTRFEFGVDLMRKQRCCTINLNNGDSTELPRSRYEK